MRKTTFVSVALSILAPGIAQGAELSANAAIEQRLQV